MRPEFRIQRTSTADAALAARPATRPEGPASSRAGGRPQAAGRDRRLPPAAAGARMRAAFRRGSRLMPGEGKAAMRRKYAVVLLIVLGIFALLSVPPW